MNPSNEPFKTFGQEPVDYVYSFKGLGNFPSKCRIRIFKSKKEHFKDAVVVVATELKENPGTSVTNFAEQLATLVAARHRIDLYKLVWVEHYRPNERDESFDRVTFNLRPDGKTLYEAKWNELTRTKVQEIVEGSL
jgi:hypothetical protein